MENIFVPYSFQKDGIYYFVRRIPAELQHHYAQKKVSYSLRTRSAKLAARRSLTAASQLDGYWDKLRDEGNRTPIQHLTNSDPARQASPADHDVDLGPSILEAVDLYLRLKGHNRPATFAAGAQRASKYLIEESGNKYLGQLKKSDATAFRDALFERGLNGSSVARVFGTIKAIITFTISEAGLEIANPFKDVFFDRRIGRKERCPIRTEDIKLIQIECQKLNDDLRWIVALVADTGMRLAEAVGLHMDDFHISEEVPFVRIQAHPWRRLKTKSSVRDVPLVGSALWAAQSIISDDKGEFAFPRYIKDGHTNANSASAALNKWLKKISSEDYSMHSFRHSMRDRLRDVGCPSELADQIGGWSKSGNVGQSYGSGYSIKVMHQWMNKAMV